MFNNIYHSFKAIFVLKNQKWLLETVPLDIVCGSVFTISLSCSIFFFYKFWICTPLATTVTQSFCSLLCGNDLNSLINQALIDSDMATAKLACVQTYNFRHNTLLHQLNPFHIPEWLQFKYFLHSFGCQEIQDLIILEYVPFTWEQELWIFNLVRKTISQVWKSQGPFCNFHNIQELSWVENIFLSRLTLRDISYDRLDPCMVDLYPPLYNFKNYDHTWYEGYSPGTDPNLYLSTYNSVLSTTPLDLNFFIC